MLHLASALLAFCSSPVSSLNAPKPDKPKLVVLISIDQFRADYVERFSENYLPAKSGNKVGGFKYIESVGTCYRDAHHGHVPTATGPGHATLLTGSEPALNGIVGNVWYDPATIDWNSGSKPKSTYCVSDPTTNGVNTQAKMSPKNLQVTTVGDELKLATNGIGKVVGVAFKDRASILMAGHAADTVIWFNGQGEWCSSSFYCPDEKLPGWVQTLNSTKPFDKYLNQTWEPLLSAPNYRVARRAPAEKPTLSGLPFSHVLGASANSSYYNNLTTSGFGNDIVESAAEAAVTAENLGQDDVPDVLAINLSSNDYVGHAYGPNSPEVMDTAIRTDRMLSRFFNKLNQSVPGGLKNVTIVITADHGVVPIVEESATNGKSGVKRISPASVEAAVNSALESAFGGKNWCLFNEPDLYLNHSLIESKKLDLETVERIASEAAMGVEGIFKAIPSKMVSRGEVPNFDFGHMAVWSYNSKLSGDVYVFEKPGFYFGGGTGTGHGSPWAYDSHVPIMIAGFGINRGSHDQRVYTRDIAPTLCKLMGIEFPSGNMGSPLPGAIRD